MLFSWRDAVYTSRGLCRQPLVSALAILSVAFGISMVTVFWGLVDVLMLRPISAPHPEQLVKISTVSPTGREGDDRLTLAAFQQLHDRSRAFSGLFAWNDDALRNLQAGDTRFLGDANEVSGDFFRSLGERPLLGRWIDESDVSLGSAESAPVAVISYRCWRLHYRADPGVIGKSIVVDDVPLTIVGVRQRNFSEINIDVTSDAIVPIGFSPSEGKNGWYNVTGRLKAGVSLQQAAAETVVLWPAILAATVSPKMPPEARALHLKRKIQLTPEATGRSSLRQRYSQPLIMLAGLAAIILLVTCINLGSIMLARTVSRTFEIQVRLALGASRWDIVWLVLSEAIAISVAGSVIGVAVAVVSARVLIDLFWTGFVAPGLHLSLDARVLALTASLAFGTAILFGLVPTIRATRLNPSLVEYNKGLTIGRHRAGKSLIVTQIVLASTLVAGAFVLAGTLYRLRSVDLGYDRHNVLVMRLFAQSNRDHLPDLSGYYQQLAGELGNIPGAEAVSYSQNTPAFAFEFPESVSSPLASVPTLGDAVGPGFFKLLKIPLLQGREFDWQDNSAAPPVAIINRSLASRLFDGEPIGRKLHYGEPANEKELTIVGVVPDGDLWSPKTQHPSAIYTPLMQFCNGCSPLVLIRTTMRPMALAHAAEHTVQLMGHQYSVRTQSLEEKVDQLLRTERLSSWLSVACGAAALLLASLGLYGLMSYMVQLRRTEVGIRMALGATRGQVLFLVLREAVSLVLVGVVVACPLGWAISRVLVVMLPNVSSKIIGGMLFSSLILLLAGSVAALAPALRASHIDPSRALRGE